MEKHIKARAGLCLVCLDKSYVPIRPTYESWVNNFIVDGYLPEDQRLPSGLCSSCSKKLKCFGNGDFSPILPPSPDYTSMRAFRYPRGEVRCECFLCQKYRVVGLASSKKYTGKRKRNQNPVDPKGSSDKKSTNSRGLLCLKCFTTIYQGCRHACNNRQLENNLKKLVPPATLEVIGSGILKKKELENDKLTLATRGLPATFVRSNLALENRLKNPKPMISLQSIKKAKLETGISDNAIKKVVRVFRDDVSVQCQSNEVKSNRN